MAKQIKAAVVAAVVVFAIATGLGALGVNAFLTTTGKIAFHAVRAMALNAFIGTLAAGVIGKMTSKGINASAENFGTKVTTKSAVAPRQIIYGTARVGGIMTQINTTGTDNNKLSMFIVESFYSVNYENVNYFIKYSTPDCKYLLFLLDFFIFRLKPKQYKKTI